MLKDKCILLGVSGGIAAYKAAELASRLKKAGARVKVIMTENATKFISPLTFESLTGNKCFTDTFDRNFEFKVEHIELAKEADILVVAPASADIIAKLACGLADDMLSTVALACTCKKLVVPAMNTRMYENPIVKDNILRLENYGFDVMEAASGYLACGDTGAGKMPEPYEIYDRIEYHTAYEKDLSGKKVLVTAGPTMEAVDPVRFISNHSSGKMGIELAKAAYYRGAKVSLVLGKTGERVVKGIETVNIISAKDMYREVISRADEADIIIKAAAVADYRPKNIAENKVKKTGEEMSIELERTDDILAYLGEHKKGRQFLCGFSMETENLLENSRKKLEKKKLDMIVANNLKTEGAGFGTDTNVASIITKDDIQSLSLMSKSELAHKILDFIKMKGNEHE
jgi:phosphopantothenoylcysteine decarboxylase/phosphopantothenate--cysteine ligase